MSGILYHQLVPENSAPNGYSQNQTIDFILKSDGRKMLKNSIRLDFDVEAFSNESTPARIALSDKIGVNHKIGAHACFSEATAETQNAGLIESIQDYSRMVNIVATGSQQEESYYTQTAQAEGRQVHAEGGRYILQQVAPPVLSKAGDDQAACVASLVAKSVDPAFTIKPMVCFNRQQGDDYSFSKNGYIRLSFTVSRNQAALQGVGVTANAALKIKNIQLRFTSRPDDGSQGKMLMNTATTLKTAVNSQQANISARVPMPACSGVVMTYTRQSAESSLQLDSQELQNYPQLDRIEYLFQDSNSRYITYPLEDPGVMMTQGLKALTDSGLNQCTLNRVVANAGVVHGLSFQSYIDMSKNKFSVQINSSSNTFTADPINVHMLFLGLIQL